jgi:fumarate reductase subunit C
MAIRQTFQRPMTGWWRRDPFFVRYMAREATAPFVAAYAIMLLVGIVSLARGEAAYTAWLEALRSPGWIAAHVLLVGIFAYHSYTWFRIMPKTMPPIRVAGRKLGPALITSAGIAVAALLSIAGWLIAAHALP